MTLEMIFTLVVLGVMFAALFFHVARPDVIVFGTLFFFLLVGFVTAEEALVGFSNQGMLTIGLLFIVAGGFQKSGLVERLVSSFLSGAERREGALSRLLLPIAGFSAFLNNTPIVVTLTPIIRKWTSSHDISPSKFLLPVSFAAIMGGTMTLMGTSTNLVIHGLLLDFGEDGFSFFQLAIVGIPVTVVGLVYLNFFAPKLLPDYKSVMEKVEAHPKDYLSEMRVQDDFPERGATVEKAGLRNLRGLYLIEIIRGKKRISPVTSQTDVCVGDRLIFTGMISMIAELQKRKGLLLDTGTDLSLEDLKNGTNKLKEVVVSHQSYLLGRTIKESRFRETYDAAVVAVHRNDERVEGKIGEVEPRAGDVLLLVTGETFEGRPEHRDYYVTTPESHHKFYENDRTGWLALGILISAIFLVTIGVLTIFKAMVIAVGLMFVFRLVTTREARNMIQFQMLLLIASALGIGNVIIQTGTADYVAGQFVSMFEPLGVIALLIIVYVLTNLFTEMITNNAAAVIMFPIAYQIAVDTGMEPIGMAMLVAVAASASFLTPIGYQTNLIVYGPGGYKFSDYFKVGFPLTVITGIVTVSIIRVLYGA